MAPQAIGCIESEYLNLLNKVIEEGEPRKDRTGVGTRALFGECIKGPIGTAFPLLTTKKIFWRGVVEELFWMISGSTNAKDLSKKGVHIWDAWSDATTGALGPIYGHFWRNYGGKIDNIRQPKPELRAELDRTHLGIANGNGSTKHVLRKVWEGMIGRCYDPKHAGYSDYGLRGVHVCNAWLEFLVFAEDAKNLPNWRLKEAQPHVYQIDKDGIGNGFIYGPGYCQWVTREQNISYSLNTEYTVEKDGIEHSFTHIGNFCKEHGAEAKVFSSLWTGYKNAEIRNGFSFVRKRDLTRGIDQLSNVIDRIKTDPTSRRLVVNSWDASQVILSALPPCHLMYQFYTKDTHSEECNAATNLTGARGCICSMVSNEYPKKYLDCMVTMRSCDIFLGLPFNIASYSLLTHLVGHVTNRTPRNLIMSLGDVHLYDNHLDVARTQLTRTGFNPPTLDLSAAPITSIDDIKPEHVKLHNYVAHEALKAKIAV